MQAMSLRALRERAWVGYLAALGAVAAMTVVIAAIVGRLPVTNLSILYLIAVLAIAVAFGSGPAVLAAIAAFLAFDWFFLEPYYSINVANPTEWADLLVFLLIAIVTGQLAASQRRVARAAREREREAVILYDIVQMMENPDLARALRGVAENLREQLHLAAVTFELPSDQGRDWKVTVGEASALASIDSARDRQGVDRAVVVASSAPSARWPGSWHRRLILGRRERFAAEGRDQLYEVPIAGPNDRAAALYLVQSSSEPPFGPTDERLLAAIGFQVGLALERAHLRREATDAEILRRSEDLRRALLHAVSHDLRTPLAAIIAEAGNLSQDDVDWSDDEVRGFGRDIESEARRLNSIVGNLLDLSRIQAGALIPQIGWYDLGVLIEDVVGRLRLVAAHHPLRCRIPEDLPPVPLDYVEIDEVLTNLIENASRFSPPGTQIDITLQSSEQYLEVEVADRGPGIPPGLVLQVFEPFFRLPVGGILKGSGLGLAVARGLVEAHGGWIRAEARDGGGSRFTFGLPLRQAAAETAPAIGGARS